MSYLKTLSNNNITLRTMLLNNRVPMYNLPYDLVRRAITPIEQIELMEAKPLEIVGYQFIKRLNESTGYIDSRVITSFLLNCHGWQTHITDFIQLISTRTNTDEAVIQIIDATIEERDRNLAVNILDNGITKYNLLIQCFNESVYETLLNKNFNCIHETTLEHILFKDENSTGRREMVESRLDDDMQTLFALHKSTRKNDMDKIRSHHVYGIPEALLRLLKPQQVFKFIDNNYAAYSAEYMDDFFYRVATIDKNINSLTDEQIGQLIEKYGFKVPHVLKQNVEVQAAKDKGLTFEINYEDPFSHTIDELNTIKTTSSIDQFRKACLTVSAITKNVNSLWLYDKYISEFRGILLPPELVVELFSKNYDFIEKAFLSQMAKTSSEEFKRNLFISNLIHNQDSALSVDQALGYVEQIANSHMTQYIFHRDDVNTNQNVLTALLDQDYDKGVDLVGYLLSKNIGNIVDNIILR